MQNKQVQNNSLTQFNTVYPRTYKQIKQRRHCSFDIHTDEQTHTNILTRTTDIQTDKNNEDIVHSTYVQTSKRIRTYSQKDTMLIIKTKQS